MFVRVGVDHQRPPMQGSLLTMGDAAMPSRIGELQRIELDHGAWIDRAQGWLVGADAWFDTLADALPWHGASRTMYDKIVDVPRLIWARPENLSEAASREREVVVAWNALAQSFAVHYGRPMPRLHANYYRDGNDSVTWHRDKVVTPTDSLVVIVSLGASRTFAIRPYGGGPVERFSLGWGDLLVMGGSMQRHYEHAVPKSSGAAPRISVMIRS